MPGSQKASRLYNPEAWRSRGTRYVPKRHGPPVECQTQGGLEGCTNPVAQGSTDEADMCGDCRRHRRQVERDARRAQLRGDA
jgi:hypothetical protein